MRVVYVRCPSCNKVLSNKELIYQSMIKSGISAKQTLDELELEVCCRIRMLGHTDVSNDILEQKYYNFINPLTPPPKLDANNFPELNSEYISKNQQKEARMVENNRVLNEGINGFSGSGFGESGFNRGLFADDEDIKII